MGGVPQRSIQRLETTHESIESMKRVTNPLINSLKAQRENGITYHVPGGAGPVTGGSRGRRDGLVDRLNTEC